LVKATISEGNDVGLSKLSLESEDGTFAYAGRHVQDEDSYVLVCRGEGKDKEMVLERMSSVHNFNLTRTPTESNAAKLASKYPPLTVEEADEGDLFGDGDETLPADDANPFDYRHFLKAELESAENLNASQDTTTRSTADTHHVQPPPITSTPSTRPAAKKRKPPAVPKSNPKRVRAGQPEPSPEPVIQKPKPNIPKLRMDRKASIRRLSIDDSGELILENETPVNERPKHSMALALGGQLGTGPISLRSAASSPGHVHSPLQAEPEASNGTFEFDLGDSEPEDEVSHHHRAPQDADEDEGELEVENDDDADVDDLELPSPAQTHRQNAAAAAATVAAGDDDDDLDKQLALAMMEDDDGSEESEEE
jgi:hypothetical protein